MQPIGQGRVPPAAATAARASAPPLRAALLILLLSLASLLSHAAASAGGAGATYHAFVAPLPRSSSHGGDRIRHRRPLASQQQEGRAEALRRQGGRGRRALWSLLEEAEEAASSQTPQEGSSGTGGAEEEHEQQREAAAKRLREELEREKANAKAMQKMKDELAAGKKRNVFTALGSVAAAVAVFFYQHTHPVEAVTLLRQMQSESPALQMVVGRNGRPTVVDFYAEWCENCKEMAPVLRAVEGRYKDKINFVAINGDTAQAADLVDRFRVDGIPHLALISKDGEVKTALIGKVPRSVIEADLDALLRGDAGLPHEGYDAFEDDDHFVRF